MDRYEKVGVSNYFEVLHHVTDDGSYQPEWKSDTAYCNFHKAIPGNMAEKLTLPGFSVAKDYLSLVLLTLSCEGADKPMRHRHEQLRLTRNHPDKEN